MILYTIAGTVCLIFSAILFDLYGVGTNPPQIVATLLAAFGVAAFLFIRGESQDRKDDREFNSHNRKQP